MKTKNPLTRDDIEKVANDSDRERLLERAGVQFITACTEGALKSSKYERKTVARRMGHDVSNLSKWKPPYEDELPLERPKADQVVAICYGADSDEPAKWLSNFCGGIFVKQYRPGTADEKISVSDMVDSVGDTLKTFAKILEDGQVDCNDREHAKEFWWQASKVASEVLALAQRIRDKAFEESA